MLDDVQEPERFEKAQLTPKPEIKPQPFVTVMNDGSVRAEQNGITPLDVQRLLLTGVAHITAQLLGRMNNADQLLGRITQRFEGFDDETAAALRQHFAP